MGQRDLTRGAVFPTMCLFALPMILGNLLQQCYNIVDSWVVGHYVSSAALGAVSENEGAFGKALIFVGLAEGVALYGLIVALLLLFA